MKDHVQLFGPDAPSLHVHGETAAMQALRARLMPVPHLDETAGVKALLQVF